ncbi:hypothetical protein [Methanosarcina sp. MSH10X1]|uniref:hypothetical protein n=1 Tax=Methanosarcina sp. MSH10X1 TaxID=2507075 RepID=UPI0013E2EA2C|nr:hypothetical protein [Methanosarcina sp. MSH10X1]
MIILIFYLLVQGSYAQNGEDADSNNAQLSEVNATIAGTINVTGTINGTITSTVDTETDSGPDTIENYEWLLLLPVLYGNLLFLSWVSRFFDKMNFCFVIFILAALLVLLLFLFCSQNIPIGTGNSSSLPFCFQTVLIGANNSSILSYFFLIIFVIASSVIFLVIIAVLYSIFFKRREDENNLIIDKNKVTVDQDNVIIDRNSVKIEENKVKIGRNNFLINTNRVPIDENSLIVTLHDILRNFIIIFTGLMWPMILFYLYLRDINYITFFETDRLEFPVYIIAAASLGILSYLFLSIEETFCQIIPEYKKISIAWSFLRRIAIAPFIALIGFYLFNHLQNIEEATEVNDYFVFVFSFFAGVFTKTIEEWIYAWVQKLLPGDKRNEFEARTEYQIKESEFVKKLRFDEDLAYALYSAKVRSIEELAACHPENLRNRLNFDTRNLGEHMGLLLTEQKERFDSYSEEQVKMYIDKARTYMSIDRSEFVTKLDMSRDLAFKLYHFANIKTLEDLKNCDPQEVHEKICDCKKDVEELAKSGKVGTEEAHRVLCDCSEEKIKDFKEKARQRLELEKKESELEEKEKNCHNKADEESKEV